MGDGYTPEQRAEILEACEDQECDGHWHACWNCGGKGGWPCPLAKER